MVAVLLAAALSPPAVAQSTPPKRQIPPMVLAELQQLEHRFELALSLDCSAERCFSKGCAYTAHAVADRPRSASLPGLGIDPGPGSVEAQAYLTRATCGFAYEESTESTDVQVLSRRLQAKMSKGWTVVSVTGEKLQPLPEYVREAPEPEPAEEPAEEPVAEPEPEPEAWSPARELWSSLLPHFFWMFGVVLVTLAATALIWAWRRVGQASIEEQMLLAQLTGGDSEPDDEGSDGVAMVQPSADGEDFEAAALSEAAWQARLEAMDPNQPDLELQALIRDRLRAHDLPLLAKAVLRFPEHFPAAFPSGGDIAAAKLELAAFLQTADDDALPSDAAFFAALDRHALSAALSTQSDAEIVRSLREDFGTAGLVSLIGALPPRIGALLFALAPLNEQYEMVLLFSPSQAAALSAELLRSNRMDPIETRYLFAVLQAARTDAPLPTPPLLEVSDRGAVFDAAGALSVLLPAVGAAQQGALFGRALAPFSGSVPSWYKDIFVAEMLRALPAEARADLVLELDINALAAWLSMQSRESRAALAGGLPSALRSSLAASSQFASRAQQITLAERGRVSLARGFQAQLARAGLSFAQVLSPTGAADA